MTHVPGGSFLMGHDGSDDDMEKPAHQVTVAPFCIDTTEVTQAAYGACVDAGRCERPEGAGAYGNTSECLGSKPGMEQHPIACVTFGDAQKYCAFVGKRLPTEEEWEFAARGTDGRLYPWGNTPPKSQARWNQQSGTWPVGSSQEGASPFGVLDMAGNVWEFTSGLNCPYSAGPNCGPWVSPVIRGGGWSTDGGERLRSTWRTYATRGERSSATGVRCAAGNPPPARVFSPSVMTLCECYKKGMMEPTCESQRAEEAIYGVNEDCIRTYANECDKMVACCRGEPAAPPTCLPGYKNWGATRFCGKVCKNDAECAKDEECAKDWGVCTTK
jgi:hypothetical protein